MDTAQSSAPLIAALILFVRYAAAIPWDQPTDNAWEFKRIRKGDFDFEPWNNLPADALELLRHMLAIDPATRATIDDIRQSAWFRRYVLSSSTPTPVLAAHVFALSVRGVMCVSAGAPRLSATGKPRKQVCHFLNQSCSPSFQILTHTFASSR